MILYGYIFSPNLISIYIFLSCDETLYLQLYFREEIHHFNLPEPNFLIEELRKDIENTEAVWLLFDEFHSELEEFAKEEWIVFR